MVLALLGMQLLPASATRRAPSTCRSVFDGLLISNVVGWSELYAASSCIQLMLIYGASRITRVPTTSTTANREEPSGDHRIPII